MLSRIRLGEVLLRPSSIFGSFFVPFLSSLGNAEVTNVVCRGPPCSNRQWVNMC